MQRAVFDRIAAAREYKHQTVVYMLLKSPLQLIRQQIHLFSTRTSAFSCEYLAWGSPVVSRCWYSESQNHRMDMEQYRCYPHSNAAYRLGELNYMCKVAQFSNPGLYPIDRCPEAAVSSSKQLSTHMELRPFISNDEPPCNFLWKWPPWFRTLFKVRWTMSLIGAKDKMQRVASISLTQHYSNGFAARQHKQNTNVSR